MISLSISEHLAELNSLTRPASLPDFMGSLPSLKNAFEALATAVHATPETNSDCLFKRGLDVVCGALSHCPLLPQTPHPQSCLQDCAVLLQDRFLYEVMFHDSCSASRRAMCQAKVSQVVEHADPLAPFLVHLMATIRPQGDDGLSQLLEGDGELLREMAKVLMVQTDQRFTTDLLRILQACAAPVSPYAIVSGLAGEKEGLLCLTAKLTICNAVMNTKGCSGLRRSTVLTCSSGSHCESPRRPPYLDTSNSHLPIRKFGSRSRF